MVSARRWAVLLGGSSLAAGCALFADLGDKRLAPADAGQEETGGDVSTPQADSGALVSEVVVGGLARPVAVAVDVANVYFCEDGAGTVKRLRKSETAPVVMAKGQPMPAQIVLDAKFVYWRNENRDGKAGDVFFDSIARLEKDKDENSEPSTLVFEGSDKRSEVTSIALFEPVGRTENLLFFARRDRVSRKPRDSEGQDNVIAQGQNEPRAIAADDGFVYWGTGDYAIRRQHKNPVGVDGGPAPAVEVLYTSPERATVIALAVDEQNLYFLDQLGRVFRGGKEPGGSPATELASSESTAAGSLVVDGQTVYWTNTDRGTVSAVSTKGGEPSRLLADRQDQPRGIAVDTFEMPRRVYWATATELRRLTVR